MFVSEIYSVWDVLMFDDLMVRNSLTSNIDLSVEEDYWVATATVNSTVYFNIIYNSNIPKWTLPQVKGKTITVEFDYYTETSNNWNFNHYDSLDSSTWTQQSSTHLNTTGEWTTLKYTTEVSEDLTRLWFRIQGATPLGKTIKIRGLKVYQSV